MELWRMVAWFAAAVAVVCTMAGVMVATARSSSLTGVRVTPIRPPAGDAAAVSWRDEPADYELLIVHGNGRLQSLGTQRMTSPRRGLEWLFDQPRAIVDVATIRLRGTDQTAMQDLTEVEVRGAKLDADGYRFVFYTKRSSTFGATSLVASPLGQALLAAFALALVVMVISLMVASQKAKGATRQPT